MLLCEYMDEYLKMSRLFSNILNSESSSKNIENQEEFVYNKIQAEIYTKLFEMIA
jgi:hypothetical protein